jgi:tetratricopeptide (TPR) repeat protein
LQEIDIQIRLSAVSILSRSMKTAVALAALIVLTVGLALNCHAQGSPGFWQSIQNPATLAQLKSFVAAKEAQANAAAKADGKGMPAEFKTFFAAANRGDWLAVSNIFEDVGQRNGQFASTNQPDWQLRGIRWSAVQEIWGVFAVLSEGNEKYSELFGNEIIRSIPPGSIYFGGTDPGRFIITAMQKSQIKGDPFFTLTQNALTDDMYLNYLRSMYRTEIYIPTDDDSTKCFKDYYSDLKQRFKRKQLNLGEDVTVDSNGVLKVSGLTAVMEINGLIAQTIFNRETNRDFYIEESTPLDWMYPYLEPHGLIFKLNRNPLAQIPDDVVKRDYDYWTNIISPMMGAWLNDNTTVADVAAFAEKVYLHHDFSGFTGDRALVENDYARGMFSADRCAIAGLYAWRAKHTDNPSEKARMNQAADFAFRQAWAMHPDVTETLFRYVQFLMDNSRTDDAIIVTRTCRKLVPGDSNVSSLLKDLENYKNQSYQRIQYSNQISAMEKEARIHPSNYTNIFWLAGCYLQMQQTNQAAELLWQTISRPDVTVGALRSAAQYFAQTDNYGDLEMTLKEMTIKEPGRPETWYDLSRIEILLGRKEESIKDLTTAITLSDERLKSNSQALDIRAITRTNTTDFKPIHNSPGFQKLVAP